MGLIEDIGPGPVGIDTAIFIYLIEAHPDWLPLVRPIFEAVDAGRVRAVTSSLTLLETLVVPYRAGDRALAERYEAILGNSRGLRMVPLDMAVIRGAAMLRARTSVATADALQLSAAAAAGCTAFLTNDRAIGPNGVMPVLQLSDYA